LAVPAASLAPAYADASPASPCSFKAPLLAKLLIAPEELARRAVILDLGNPSQALLDRLSNNRPCRVEIAGLARQENFSALNDPEAIAERGHDILQTLLPPPNNELLDLILCWDLPNYLTLPGLTLLIDVLAPRTAPGCKLHMLITYSKREMSSEPAHYIPGNDALLNQVPRTGKIDQAPRYSPEDLGKAMGGFRYQRGVLLSNGMQEFVYARPTEPGTKDGAFSIS